MRRSLAYLREQGYVCDIVEHRVPKTVVTRDLFNMFDILAMKLGHPLLGVQTTVRGEQARRRRKLQESGHLSTWLSTGARAVVHGWARVGPRGETKRWECNVWEATP